MQCHECRARPARRHCPAVGRSICTRCCGTKRQVEIQCPDSCSYLLASRQHPPSAERRQAEFDAAIMSPVVAGLTPGQERILTRLVVAVAAFPADLLMPLADADVGEAARALAATYETVARGVIYEHRAESAGARRLAATIGRSLAELERRSPAGFAADAVLVLRRLERAARDAGRHPAGGVSALCALLGRVSREFPASVVEGGVADEEPVGPAARSPGRLIVPGR